MELITCLEQNGYEEELKRAEADGYTVKEQGPGRAIFEKAGEYRVVIMDGGKARKMTCCLCGREFYDVSGNDPFPVMKRPGAVCCHDCNVRVVIPARMELAKRA